jgi:hypothetical protein
MKVSVAGSCANAQQTEIVRSAHEEYLSTRFLILINSFRVADPTSQNLRRRWPTAKRDRMGGGPQGEEKQVVVSQ